MITITYYEALAVAQDLTEHGNSTNDNPEYTRGIVELLANAFGYEGVEGDVRKEQIEADISR